MPRKALTSGEVETFRKRLAEHAIRLFAQQGSEGVTLRAIAQELGVSPMTPYRYFRSKEEILVAARSIAFRHFAEGQASAFASTDDPAERIRAVVDAYFRFAVENPHEYRIMFELKQPDQESFAELRRSFRRAYRPVRTAVEEAIRARLLRGDADTIAHMIWSSCHGLVSLHLSGMLVLGRSIGQLREPMLRGIFRGEGPGSTPERRRARGASIRSRDG